MMLKLIRLRNTILLASIFTFKIELSKVILVGGSYVPQNYTAKFATKHKTYRCLHK